jgi:8-oxo-dGTP diphosphatase
MESAPRRRINVVAGLIFRDGRLLACQRHEKSAFPLKWEFPGGKVESGESDADALRRELKEELGISVSAMTFFHEHEHAYPDGPDVLLRFFKIMTFDREVTNLVFQRIEWLDLSELADRDFLEGDIPLIKILAQNDAGPVPR